MKKQLAYSLTYLLTYYTHCEIEQKYVRATYLLDII